MNNLHSCRYYSLFLRFISWVPLNLGFSKYVPGLLVSEPFDVIQILRDPNLNSMREGLHF